MSWRRSLDAVVVQSAAIDDPAVLPGTAAVVWDLLVEPATADELVDALVEVYGGDRTVIARDVELLLDRLQTLAVIEAA